MLSNVYFIAKFRFNTAESEPFANFAASSSSAAPCAAAGEYLEEDEPDRRLAPAHDFELVPFEVLPQFR